jgi:cytoskeleton protein RodZ
LTDHILTGVGAALKRAREAAGLGVEEVAQQLKLLPRQIESLEHERFDRLPGPAIARGMIRNYARLLKLEPEPLVERLAPQKAANRAQIAGRHRPQMPSSSASRRSTLFLVGFSIALLAVVGAVAYQWQREKAAPGPTPAASAVLEAPAEKPPAHQELAKPVEEPAASEKPQTALAEAPSPVKPEPEIAAAPALPSGTHRLVLRMEEEAWLEVRDGAGRTLVSSLSPAGSERALRGQPPFQVVIGNASHVQLIYDGKPVELKPHTRGEVARLTLK